MQQILVHLLGDFVLQTDWMALNKSKRSLPCLTHICIYTACFLLLTTSWKALLVIGATHFIIDRFPFILRRLIWIKNHFPTGEYPPFEYCNSTGYFDDSPYNTKPASKAMIDKHGKPRHFFITIWIYIAIDNFLHLTINYLALRYLT